MSDTHTSKYLEVRSYTLAICIPLGAEDYIPQPAEFVSPAKWHLGHTTWFFEEFILSKHLKAYKRFDQEFAFVFNSYYNAIGERIQRAMRGNLSRPSLERVVEYRKYIDEHMTELLSGELNDELESLLDIGLNHEQQHQELLFTDIKYVLGHNPLFPAYREGESYVNNRNAESGWATIDEGVHEVGFSGNGFSYDNEHGLHQSFIQGIEVSKALVTNAEYLDFVQDAGYERHELWLDEGWGWIKENEITKPLYWHKVDDQWAQYTLGGLATLNPEAQLAHISHYEAAAYAEWKGMRLPTEFEWEIASKKLNWGTRWEHTNSAYLAYPGFKKPAGAVGEYNGKFMMNQMVQRGASVVTSPGHNRITYRNFFHPNMQWQFSGIRLVKND
ncbi:MAG: ergothioneine biosynthesis protein EgtB [Flavobacteriales bacterium]|nr:ergothioneine biosynthesis protein EgtB [Flavobacteriales bacterium]